MDAKKLYDELRNSKETADIADIFDCPESRGRLEICEVECIAADFEVLGNSIESKLTFSKKCCTYQMNLFEVVRSFNRLPGGVPQVISIENGANDLTINIYEKEQDDALFSVSFGSGSIEKIYPVSEYLNKIFLS